MIREHMQVPQIIALAMAHLSAAQLAALARG
jgi:hypothetical protein